MEVKIMNDTQEQSSLNLEILAKRLESIETSLFALQVNAALSELETFEGPGTEEDAIIQPVTLSSALETYIDGLGLQYFKGRELTPYWSRSCGNIRNSVPPQNLWTNIAPTLTVLNRLRRDLKGAITITSSYRDSDYNACVGGVSNSQHRFFMAVDFVAKTGTPAVWAAKLRSYRGQQFTIPGIGNYTFKGGIGTYSSFVHLDTRGYNADWHG
jgi:hypothetical protein